MTNLALEYLAHHGETLEDYDGVCGELAGAMMQPGDRLLYVEGDIGWRYHMALLRDGLVHDGWCEAGALTLRKWLVKMFGQHAYVEVSIDGGDPIYAGACRRFPLEVR